MNVLTLTEAAEFLHMNAEVLRRKTKKGEVPGKKTGKSYVFIKEHLADWVSGRFTPQAPLELKVIDGGLTYKSKHTCQSTNAAKPTGFNSPAQTANEYSALLGLNQNKKRKSCTTSSKRQPGVSTN